jgi:hypothetical protein
MGKCRICGEDAGFLRTQHRECAERQRASRSGILEAIRDTAAGKRSLDALLPQITELARSGRLPEPEVREASISAWVGAAEHFLDDGELDPKEEERLHAMREALSLTQGDLDAGGMYTKVAGAAAIRDLLQGKLPERFQVRGSLPFNFQKGETLIWAFPKVEYLEDKTRTEYQGGSQGLSFRIAKGVYYRMGAFKGHPVQRTERVHADTGVLAITSKHIYFGGDEKSFRVRFDRIVSFLAFTDGVGIVRDAANARPQIFVTGDGWLAYNLVTAASHL